MKTAPRWQYLHLPAVLLLLSFTPWLLHAAEEFVVSDLLFDEYNPDVQGHTVVWETWNSDYSDWDALGANIEDTNLPEAFPVSETFGDEVEPRLSQGWVVWQHRVLGAEDWDIYARKLDPSQKQTFVIAGTFDNEVLPTMSGSTVVWQHQFESFPDWDILMADISDPSAPVYTTLAATESNEMTPTVSGTLVAWKEDNGGSGDFYVSGAEVSDPNESRPFLTFQIIGEESRPVLSQPWVIGLDQETNGAIFAEDLFDPFLPEPITGQTSGQVAQPDAAQHIVVWQDDRNGNWDIYGYNITTGQEFQITDHPADQQYPAIAALGEYCFTVVWEDNRNGNWDIYGTRICDDRVAGCLSMAPYDINKDCKIDFSDFSLLADHWLEEL